MPRSMRCCASTSSTWWCCTPRTAASTTCSPASPGWRSRCSRSTRRPTASATATAASSPPCRRSGAAWHRMRRSSTAAITRSTSRRSRGLPNRPFALRTPDGAPLPHGVITRDLVHRFYENQLQINGGRNDGFVAWGNTGAMPMGHYADSADHLRLWQLARQYTLCDNFFMGAFGGSFLNHQYLVAAQPPFYPHADQSPAKIQIAAVEGDDPTGIRPKLAEDSPASAMQGRAKFASRDALTPDFWAVNTMGPAYAPAFSRRQARPALRRSGQPEHAAAADPSRPSATRCPAPASTGPGMPAPGNSRWTATATATTRRSRKYRISRPTTSRSTTSATSRPARRRGSSTCAMPASAAAPTPIISSPRSRPARCRRCRSTNRRAISTCTPATPA